MNKTIKIRYDSPEAAQQVTVTGWQSRDGRFYGNDEHLARWAGCTYLICACGAEMEKGYTACKACQNKADAEKYEAMPFKDWDGKTPLALYDDDIYFWDEDDVLEHCEEHDCQPEDLRLVICEPQYTEEIKPNEYLCDILPEDQYLDDIDSELSEAFEALNKVIRQKKTPISWIGGKYRTTVTLAVERFT